MNDDISITTRRRTYGSRLGSAISAIVFGLVLVLGGGMLLWWNEAQSLERAETLETGAKATVSLTEPRYDSRYDGMPVHVTGTLHGGPLADPLFGVRAEGLALQRHVEMYQWREQRSETRHEAVGGQVTVKTTYRYEREWLETPVDSSRFKKSLDHRNPVFPYRSQRFSIPATVGDFALSPNVLEQVEAAEPCRPGELNTAEAVRLVGTRLYRGTDPDAPQVGDVRITYTLLPGGVFSIVGEQTPQKRLKVYKAEGGREIALIRPGIHTARELFAQAERDNALTAWGLRALGLALMFIGFALILNPLSVLFSLIPPLGHIVAAGTALIALLLTLLLGGGIIVTAWFAQRPWLAGILAALLLLVVLRVEKRAGAF